MEANKILQSNLLDILFEDRNKSYGAYELRSNYNRRIKQSIVAMAGVCLVFFTGVLLANSGEKKVTQPVYTEVRLESVPIEKMKEVIPEQPKPKKTEIKTISFTPPKIVVDDQVKETEIPDIAEIEKAAVSTETKDGLVPGITAPPIEKPTGQAEIPSRDKEPEDTYVIQTEAKFPGGIAGWTKYLERTLNTAVPIENGAPAGTYSVMVSFTVDKDGNVSDVQALNDPGYGTAEEAVKAIKKSRQWIPAFQNGRNVTYRQKQSVTFVVTEG
ncbi:MAG TPA: energy transducer TonB [Panacibacter sp.]|nr:energy transducer TonB [Panacibacter sp.]